MASKEPAFDALGRVTLHHSLIEIDRRLQDLNASNGPFGPAMQGAEGADAAIERSYSELTIAAPDTQRLRLHLPDGHPTVETNWALTAALLNYREELVRWYRELIYQKVPRPTNRDTTQQVTKRVGDCLNEFTAASLAWADETAGRRWLRSHSCNATRNVAARSAFAS